MSRHDNRTIATVLVATDFSDTARAGLDWAVEIAREHDATIVLVHGLELPNRSADYLPSPPDLTAELREAARRRLGETAATVRERGLRVDADLLLGLPSLAIVEAAKKRGADLVVIGTRGLTGIRHLLLGSTAERVVQKAPCPVLSVHTGDLDQHRRVRRILVPTDFSRDAEVATAAALDLLPPGGEDAELVLMHAYHLPFEYTAYGTIPTAVDYFRDVEGQARDRLEAIAAELGTEGLAVSTEAREGYPPDAIVACAREIEADLICLGIHGHTGLKHLLLGSTAERVLQHAGCPVLTVRRPD